jgi:hypothetical protein
MDMPIDEHGAALPFARVSPIPTDHEPGSLLKRLRKMLDADENRGHE